MTKLTLYPKPGLQVRKADGQPLAATGESVEMSTYYRRRIQCGDLVCEPSDPLFSALASLDPDTPGHWTGSGKPDLDHLSGLLNRRVSRREVDTLLKEMES